MAGGVGVGDSMSVASWLWPGCGQADCCPWKISWTGHLERASECPLPWGLQGRTGYNPQAEFSPSTQNCAGGSGGRSDPGAVLPTELKISRQQALRSERCLCVGFPG